jgi:hypothetical protein
MITEFGVWSPKGTHLRMAEVVERTIRGHGLKLIACFWGKEKKNYFGKIIDVNVVRWGGIV